MFTFFVRRLFTLIPTLVFVSMLIFSLQQLLPGDPALVLAGEDPSPEAIAHIRAKLHLDDPLPVRYGYWIAGVLQGDLGESARTHQPVLELILQKLPVTIELALLALLIALVISIPAGIVSAVYKGSAVDTGATVFALTGLSTPNFWLGIMLILLFSVELGWLPASGYVSPFENLRANLASMIMPAFVLGNAIAASLMRHMRSSMLQELSADYVRTARAKGLSERVVLFKHVLRNALLPILTGAVASLPLLFMGSLISESFFGIPGLGSYTLDALSGQDFSIVRAMVFLGSSLYIVGLIMADISYTLADPRVRFE